MARGSARRCIGSTGQLGRRRGHTDLDQQVCFFQRYHRKVTVAAGLAPNAAAAAEENQTRRTPKAMLGSMRALVLPKRRMKNEGALVEEEEEKEKEVRLVQ